MLKIDFEKFKIYLCAIYAPTQRHLQQQVDFLTGLKETLENFQTDEFSHTICLGDFNVRMSELDVQKCRFRRLRVQNA